MVGTVGIAVSVAVVGGSTGTGGALVVVAARVMAQFVSKGIISCGEKRMKMR